MTKCLTFPLPLPWYFIFLWIPQLKVGEELELILRLLPETWCRRMWLVSPSWSQHWAPALLGPSGPWCWALALQHGEDAQMKNREMLPFVAATDNSREKENVIIIVFQGQSKLWRDKRIRGWALGKMASAFCSAFLCDVDEDIYFFSAPSKARLTAFPHLTWRIGREREWGCNHSVSVRSLLIVMET